MLTERADYEIFRLRDEVASNEGPDVTFYEFLGVQSSASQTELSKALKKKSRTLHPDKVKQQFIASRSIPKGKKKGDKSPPGVRVSRGPSEKEVSKTYKQAHERYVRLSLVAKILQGENRERYDHFLANGFPMWRGTGYYYARFRPGLGSVLVGLFLFLGGGAHYGALVLSWKRQRDFIDRYIRQARRTAWGDETGIRGIPGMGNAAPAQPPPTSDESEGPMAINRRQKRQHDRDTKKDKSGKGRASRNKVTSEAGPAGERRRVVAENGKVLIVDAIGNVYLEEDDEDGNPQQFFLDLDEIPKPTIKDTAVYRFPMWAFNKATARFWKASEEEEYENQPEIVISDSSQDSGYEVVSKDNPVDSMAQANGTAKKRGKKGRS